MALPREGAGVRAARSRWRRGQAEDQPPALREGSELRLRAPAPSGEWIRQPALRQEPLARQRRAAELISGAGQGEGS